MTPIADRTGQGSSSIEAGWCQLRLKVTQASPTDLADLVRNHWQIEAHHNIRDTTLNEDASQIQTGNRPRAMAILRNIAVNLFRCFRFDNIAAARRDMAWDHTGLVLDLLGV